MRVAFIKREYLTAKQVEAAEDRGIRGGYYELIFKNYQNNASGSYHVPIYTRHHGAGPR
jgi:hypothetical protein